MLKIGTHITNTSTQSNELLKYFFEPILCLCAINKIIKPIKVIMRCIIINIIVIDLLVLAICWCLIKGFSGVLLWCVMCGVIPAYLAQLSNIHINHY